MSCPSIRAARTRTAIWSRPATTATKARVLRTPNDAGPYFTRIARIRFVGLFPELYSIRVTRNDAGDESDTGETYALAWRTVPEPTTLALAMIGLATLALLGRRSTR